MAKKSKKSNIAEKVHEIDSTDKSLDAHTEDNILNSVQIPVDSQETDSIIEEVETVIDVGDPVIEEVKPVTESAPVLTTKIAEAPKVVDAQIDERRRRRLLGFN